MLGGTADEAPQTAGCPAECRCAAGYLGRFGGGSPARQRCISPSCTPARSPRNPRDRPRHHHRRSHRGVLRALGEPGSTRERLRRIGDIALAADTVPERVRREVIAHRLPPRDWPDRDLRITAIDTATGELVVFTHESALRWWTPSPPAARCPAPGPRSPSGPHSWTAGRAARPTWPPPPTAPLRWCWCPLLIRRRRRRSVTGAGAEIAAFPGVTFTAFADDEH